MRILLVGALSWNPERIRSLADRGHRLGGLWSRSTGWDQGPYPVLDRAVERVTPEEAARTLAPRVARKLRAETRSRAREHRVRRNAEALPRGATSA